MNARRLAEQQSSSGMNGKEKGAVCLATPHTRMRQSRM